MAGSAAVRARSNRGVGMVEIIVVVVLVAGLVGMVRALGSAVAMVLSGQDKGD